MDGDGQGSDQSCNLARAALSKSPIFALRTLDVDKHGDSIVLSGRVKSFYEKQQAQELVRMVTGNMELVNSVSVEEHNS